jgi:O-acetyl-ADP-ribose deacetylase (regulator of RNase III)
MIQTARNAARRNASSIPVKDDDADHTRDRNLLKEDVDALVNTVNTQGIMGKGIALQFKKAWPEMFKSYEAACKRGEVTLGRMHVGETGSLAGPRYIINFPTKGHWRSRSKIADIDAGLNDLTQVIRERGITSIAIPPLGCGNGGLDWREVEPRMLRSLKPLADTVDIRIFPCFRWHEAARYGPDSDGSIYRQYLLS